MADLDTKLATARESRSPAWRLLAGALAIAPLYIGTMREANAQNPASPPPTQQDQVTVPQLQQLLINPKASVASKQSAAVQLGQKQDDPATLYYLFAALRDPAPDVSQAAAKSLIQWGPKAAAYTQPMINLYTNSFMENGMARHDVNEYSTQYLLLQAIAATKGPTVVPLMQAIVDQRNETSAG